jgi:hypothetical protein
MVAGYQADAMGDIRRGQDQGVGVEGFVIADLDQEDLRALVRGGVHSTFDDRPLAGDRADNGRRKGLLIAAIFTIAGEDTKKIACPVGYGRAGIKPISGKIVNGDDGAEFFF